MEYVKIVLERSVEVNVKLLFTILSEYESILKINEDYSVEKNLNLLVNYSNNKPEWLPAVFELSLDLDIQLNQVSHLLDVTSKLVFEIVDSTLPFNRDDFQACFKYTKRINTSSAVPTSNKISIAKYCEKFLSKSSLEYRILRLYVLCSVLGLINTTSILSKLILSQLEITTLKRFSSIW